jgi:hypothetical protein
MRILLAVVALLFALPTAAQAADINFGMLTPAQNARNSCSGIRTGRVRADDLNHRHSALMSRSVISRSPYFAMGAWASEQPRERTGVHAGWIRAVARPHLGCPRPGGAKRPSFEGAVG